MKMHHEKFEKLTKKEKEAYWGNWRKEREIIRNMSNDEKKAFYNERERQYEEEYNEWIKQNLS